MGNYANEIEKRRTFAIISHPDAGKTTLTEKFLLYGGAINLAGSVKGKATARHAVSDWMEIEKERGISVTSSVLQFNYDGYCIFLEAYAWIDKNEIEIEVEDCSDEVYGRKCGFDYLKYISEPNYLKRDYSDKLLAYTCNLLELYGQYFEKQNDSIGLSIHMNGDKCFGGRGFVEWS